jgi:hypothetical protein
MCAWKVGKPREEHFLHKEELGAYVGYDVRRN